LEQEATVQALCAAFPELEASLVHILYREHGECDELMQQLQLLCGGAAGEARCAGFPPVSFPRFTA